MGLFPKSGEDQRDCEIVNYKYPSYTVTKAALAQEIELVHQTVSPHERVRSGDETKCLAIQYFDCDNAVKIVHFPSGAATNDHFE